MESTSFKELCQALHPGYKPPDRKVIGNEILDNLLAQLESKCSQELNGKEVTLCIDGWSNTCKAEDAEKHGAKVVAVVTDNAANMNFLRETLEKKTPLITYGCGAHQMNLLVGDLVPT